MRHDLASRKKFLKILHRLKCSKAQNRRCEHFYFDREVNFRVLNLDGRLFGGGSSRLRKLFVEKIDEPRLLLIFLNQKFEPDALFLY